MSVALQPDLLPGPDQMLADGRRQALVLAEPITAESERLALARTYCTLVIRGYRTALDNAHPPIVSKRFSRRDRFTTHEAARLGG